MTNCIYRETILSRRLADARSLPRLDRLGLTLTKLDRLKQELQETKSLLSSPRVTDATRYVLERLREDLEMQIAELEDRGQPEPGNLGRGSGF